MILKDVVIAPSYGSGGILIVRMSIIGALLAKKLISSKNS